MVNGRRTVWCAQHDETTLRPAGARTYEHASLSGYESVGIVRFLMGIERLLSKDFPEWREKWRAARGR